MNIETTSRAMIEVLDNWITPQLQQVLDDYNGERFSRYPGCSILMLEDSSDPDRLVGFINTIDNMLEESGLESEFSVIA
tara:strand:+ start:5629 stop:5865 length:237 start_codon:yes stop_codon:yes gene_type:complete